MGKNFIGDLRNMLGALSAGRKTCLKKVIATVGITSRNDDDAIINKIKAEIVNVENRMNELHKETIRHQIFCKWSIFDKIEENIHGKQDFITCPLCKTRGESGHFKVFESSCIFGGGKIIRYQCPKCDLIFGPNKMLILSPAELDQEYEWHYRVFSEGDSTEKEIRAFHALNPRKEGVYLNYGAGGWSKSVSILREQGWNVLGFEPHASASAHENFTIGDRKELLSMKFDGIFSNNVLEHFRFPVDEFKFMASLLKNDGDMSHATPCFDYLYEFTRFHLFFYLGSSKKILADLSNLNIVDFIKDGEFMCLHLNRKKP